MAEFIDGLSDADLNSAIQESMESGDTTQWWAITRGLIDHEIHHRGQLQVLLRLKYGG